MPSLNKIHNSLICIVLMFLVCEFVCQEITSPFLLTGGIWSGIAVGCCSAQSVGSLSVQDLAGGGDRLAVGKPVVYMLTVGATVREAFMTFRTLEGLLSAVKSLVFC